MPFFLFADTIVVGAVLMVWLTLEGFILVPAKDGAMALLLGVHGLLVLWAVYKRNRIEISWFGLRHFSLAGLFTLAVFLAAHIYLLAPPLATIRWTGVPVEAAMLPGYNLALRDHLTLLGCWMMGGLGAAALCFGLLCLELERSGSRQIAVYIGASGYAVLFLGQAIYYLIQSPGETAHLLRAIVIMTDRWLIAFAAGYLFIATRHLLSAGILLGAHEWIARYGLNEVQNTLYQPLIVLEAGNQKIYWIARLASGALALVAAMWIYRRWGRPATEEAATDRPRPETPPALVDKVKGAS